MQPRTLVIAQLNDALIISENMKLSRHSYSLCVRINNAMRRAEDRQMLVYYLFSLRFTFDMEALMAARNNDFNLIEYRLTDEELTEFDAWVAKQAGDPTEVLTAFAAQNYKISLTYVEKSEAWCVSITGKEDAKFNSKATPALLNCNASRGSTYCWRSYGSHRQTKLMCSCRRCPP